MRRAAAGADGLRVPCHERARTNSTRFPHSGRKFRRPSHRRGCPTELARGSAHRHTERAAMLVFHILAGSVSLLAGYLALLSTKGGTLHRRAGTAFAVAMLAMTATGAGMAAVDGEAGARISVIAGLLGFGLEIG